MSLQHSTLICAAVFHLVSPHAPEIAQAQVSPLSFDGIVSHGPAVCLGDDLYFFAQIPQQRSEVPLYMEMARAAEESTEYNLFRARIGEENAVSLMASGETAQFLGGTLIADPVRGQLATVHSAQASGWDAPTQIVTLDLETMDLHVAVDNRRHNTYPAFSPDGSMIAFFSAPADIHYRQNIAGQPIDGYQLHVVDLQSGEESTLSGPSRTPFASSSPAWSPGGSRLAFTAMLDFNQGVAVHIADVAGGDVLTLPVSDGPIAADSVIWVDENEVLFTRDGLRLCRQAADGSGEAIQVTERQISGPLMISPDHGVVLGQEVRTNGRLTQILLTAEGALFSGNTDEVLHNGILRQAP
jgi:WD40-like Beta Propeller Repeat